MDDPTDNTKSHTYHIINSKRNMILPVCIQPHRLFFHYSSIHYSIHHIRSHNRCTQNRNNYAHSPPSEPHMLLYIWFIRTNIIYKYELFYANRSNRTFSPNVKTLSEMPDARSVRVTASVKWRDFRDEKCIVPLYIHIFCTRILRRNNGHTATEKSSPKCVKQRK